MIPNAHQPTVVMTKKARRFLKNTKPSKNDEHEFKNGATHRRMQECWGCKVSLSAVSLKECNLERSVFRVQRQGKHQDTHWTTLSYTTAHIEIPTRLTSVLTRTDVRFSSHTPQNVGAIEELPVFRNEGDPCYRRLRANTCTACEENPAVMRHARAVGDGRHFNLEDVVNQL